jgi:predicted DNA-binding WGR domain protein
MSSPKGGRMSYRGSPDQGCSSQGANDRASHHERTRNAKARDHEAGHLRHGGNSVSGSYLVKHDPGTSAEMDHFWSCTLRGEECLVAWGKVNTQGKSELKTFPDALLAERWASDTVVDKLKQGYEVREGEGAAALMRQEGMPRVPTEPETPAGKHKR